MRPEERRTSAIPVDRELEWRIVKHFQRKRHGTGRMRVSERLAHVAASLERRWHVVRASDDGRGELHIHRPPPRFVPCVNGSEDSPRKSHRGAHHREDEPRPTPSHHANPAPRASSLHPYPSSFIPHPSSFLPRPLHRPLSAITLGIIDTTQTDAPSPGSAWQVRLLPFQKGPPDGSLLAPPRCIFAHRLRTPR